MKIKNIILIFICTLCVNLLFFSSTAQALHYTNSTKGYILLQVEKNGEAWYVYPKNSERYYLGRPTDAFVIMRKLSLGAKHSLIAGTEIFPQNLAGMILLDVEKNGEAYYIYPGDLRKYYLGRPADAFQIMSNLGLGISNRDLTVIPVGDIDKTNELPTTTKNYLIENVPFTSQAPFGDWKDQRQQDGCEESSSLMALKWARGESLTSSEALNEITNASDYLLKQYGEYRDISAANTVDWIIKDYFDYPNALFKKNINVSDIINELSQGHLVLVPMNGQLLHNPYFSPPGPIRHMVVVSGYNADRNTFITQDPGTRHGQNYEYDTKIFYDAIRDYPTGYHELIEVIEKNIIVVWK